MNSKAIVKVTREVGKVISDNSSSILTGFAVGGLVTTVGMAIKATPSAIAKIKQETDERIERLDEDIVFTELTVLDVIKLTWRCYLPSAFMGLATVGCIIGSNAIGLRRSAALASAYGLVETALTEYQQKVLETIGKNKEQKVRDDIAQDRLTKDPIDKKTIIITGNGDQLCYDSISGRYFQNDVENIRRVQNDLNGQMFREGHITMNDLFYSLGLEGIDLGADIGWDIDHYQLDIDFAAKIAKDGRPCLVLTYKIPPRQL